jgi:hypothetical protein
LRKYIADEMGVLNKIKKEKKKATQLFEDVETFVNEEDVLEKKLIKYFNENETIFTKTVLNDFIRDNENGRGLKESNSKKAFFNYIIKKIVSKEYDLQKLLNYLKQFEKKSFDSINISEVSNVPVKKNVKKDDDKLYFINNILLEQSSTSYLIDNIVSKMTEKEINDYLKVLEDFYNEEEFQSLFIQKKSDVNFNRKAVSKRYSQLLTTKGLINSVKEILKKKGVSVPAPAKKSKVNVYNLDKDIEYIIKNLDDPYLSMVIQQREIGKKLVEVIEAQYNKQPNQEGYIYPTDLFFTPELKKLYTELYDYYRKVGVNPIETFNNIYNIVVDIIDDVKPDDTKKKIAPFKRNDLYESLGSNSVNMDVMFYGKNLPAKTKEKLLKDLQEMAKKKGSGRKKVMKKKKGGASTEQIGRASAYRTFTEYGKPTYKLLSDIVHSADIGYYNDSGKYVRANQSLFRDYNLKHNDDVEEILRTMYPSYMNQLFYSFKPSKKGFVKPDIRNFVRELMKADNKDPNDEELFKNYLQTIRDSIIGKFKDAPQGIPANERWGANNRTVNKYLNQYV